VVDRIGLSQRRSCILIGIDRASCRYRTRREPEEELRAKLVELARERPRWGYRTLCDVLRRERVVNHKKVHRLYKLEGLHVRRRRRKRVVAGKLVPLVAARPANERWSMDPVQNAFVESFNGKFRDECLNEHWFVDLHDARRIIETYRRDYNSYRPHSLLGA
jgi:transposase InsO family protein